MNSPRPTLLARFNFSDRFLHLFPGTSAFKLEIQHPAIIAIALFATSLLFGIFYRPFLWIGTAGFLTLAHQYFRLKAISDLLQVTRSLPKNRINKGEELEIFYSVWNRSTSPCSPFKMQDLTMYLRREQSFFAPNRSLRPNEKVSFKWRGVTEAPAGDLKLGPFRLELQDELGLFQVNLIQDDELKIHVQHGRQIERETYLRTPHTSPLVGDLNISRSGHGLILFGLREYREGDPLSHIWWKKSVGEDDEEFLVKEFENDISRRVSVLVTTDSELHLGYAASSTWEIAKLSALKVIQGYLNAQSAVSLITGESQLKDISGIENLQIFQSTLAKLRLKPKTANRWVVGAANPAAGEVHDEIELVSHYLNPPSLFYLITPYHPETEDACRRQLQHLQSQGFQPAVIFVDPTSSVNMVKKRFGDFEELVKPLADLGPAVSVEISNRFRRCGVPVYWATAIDQTGQTEVHRHGIPA